MTSDIAQLKRGMFGDCRPRQKPSHDTGKSVPALCRAEYLIELKEIFALIIAPCKNFNVNSDKKDVIIDQTQSDWAGFD